MEKIDKKIMLSTLWIFLTVNYIFCDVFTLFHAPDLNQFLTGYAGGMALTQSFLLTFAMIMELAMLMIVFSRILKYKTNRIVNIIGGLVFTIIQAGTLFSGDFTMHYFFFSVIEIATTIIISMVAWKWKNVE